MTFPLLRLLHIAFMAAWGAWALQGIFQALALTQVTFSDKKARHRHAGRVQGLGMIAAMGTLVTGGALLFSGGGFGVQPWPVHVGAVLALVMLFVGALGVGRAATEAEEAQDAGRPAADLAPEARQLLLWNGVVLGLWCGVVALMVLRHQVAGAV